MEEILEQLDRINIGLKAENFFKKNFREITKARSLQEPEKYRKYHEFDNELKRLYSQEEEFNEQQYHQSNHLLVNLLGI